jgi:hypothetical protein
MPPIRSSEERSLDQENGHAIRVAVFSSRIIERVIDHPGPVFIVAEIFELNCRLKLFGVRV